MSPQFPAWKVGAAHGPSSLCWGTRSSEARPALPVAWAPGGPGHATWGGFDEVLSLDLPLVVVQGADSRWPRVQDLGREVLGTWSPPLPWVEAKELRLVPGASTVSALPGVSYRNACVLWAGARGLPRL